MFEKLDRICLRLAERASKWFNWSTGLDNFELARKLNWAFYAYAAVRLIILATTGRWYIFLGCLNPFVALFAWRMYYEINDVERKKNAERREGAKNLELELRLRLDRRLLWSVVILISLLYLIWMDDKVLLGSRLILQPLSLVILGGEYLISVDKPPYSRSKAREWLKSLFTAPATPALAPVTVPSGPSHQTASFIYALRASAPRTSFCIFLSPRAVRP